LVEIFQEFFFERIFFFFCWKNFKKSSGFFRKMMKIRKSRRFRILFLKNKEPFEKEIGKFFVPQLKENERKLSQKTQAK